mmetsp:Transcript_11497/g.24107  ORF Transcript_11497/g.24107 Transcript_11497/m.24107 type:complete len:240 (+) Transcript_11497:131-850(+)
MPRALRARCWRLQSRRSPRCCNPLTRVRLRVGPTVQANRRCTRSWAGCPHPSATAPQLPRLWRSSSSPRSRSGSSSHGPPRSRRRSRNHRLLPRAQSRGACRTRRRRSLSHRPDIATGFGRAGSRPCSGDPGRVVLGPHLAGPRCRRRHHPQRPRCRRCCHRAWRHPRHRRPALRPKWPRGAAQTRCSSASGRPALGRSASGRPAWRCLRLWRTQLCRAPCRRTLRRPRFPSSAASREA